MAVTSAGRPELSSIIVVSMVSPRAGRIMAHLTRFPLADPVCPGPHVRVSPGVCLPPAVHANPDADPGARITACAGLRPVPGEDRLAACPAWLHRMTQAELGRFSVASMVSRRAGHAVTELAGPLSRSLCHPTPIRRVGQTGTR